MSNDARLSTGLPGHPKTKKLIRRLGPAAGWHLVCLILWARDNRPDGDLSGMTVEDIELAVDWHGENDAFVTELVGVGFLDGAEGRFHLHDWEEHQPWAVGSEARSDRAKWAALIRRHGIEEATRIMPAYAAKLASSSDKPANSTVASANSRGLADHSPAKTGKPPAPSPSPSPKAEQLQASPSGDRPAEPLTLTNVSSHPEHRICETVMAAYHDALPRCQQVAVLNPKRQRRILAAHKLARKVCDQQGWTMGTREFWDAYFAECADDPWLRGDVPNPNNPRWKQNLDVLLAEDRFAQIMDKAIAAMKAEEAA